MNSRYFILWLTITPLISCQKDDSSLITEEDTVGEESSITGVDPFLLEYFISFEEAGKERGLEIDLSTANITGSISEIQEENVAGQCNYHPFQPNHVTIDKSFWNRSNYLYREMIVFHELGHCYLGRDHFEEAFQNGLCKSIMRSGTCCCRDAYTLKNRAYYLDELFGILEATIVSN